MVSGKVTVKNPTGLHLRPAGTLCKQAMQFKSSDRKSTRLNSSHPSSSRMPSSA